MGTTAPSSIPPMGERLGCPLLTNPLHPTYASRIQILVLPQLVLAEWNPCLGAWTFKPWTGSLPTVIRSKVLPCSNLPMTGFIRLLWGGGSFLNRPGRRKGGGGRPGAPGGHQRSQVHAGLYGRVRTALGLALQQLSNLLKTVTISWLITPGFVTQVTNTFL